MSFSVMAYVIAFSFGLVLSGRAVLRRGWEGLGVWVVLMMGGLIGLGCAGLQLGRIAGAFEFVEF